ncbi:MAG: threonine ammonia-lyase [Eubacteriales bacterium]|nr:threonine ammonia-lyase [Bacillota bacterium]
MSEGELNLEKIYTARRRLEGVAYRTPLDYSTTFSGLTGNNVYLKLENMQKTGSFKIRGAFNKLSDLSGEERARGVIAASAGNHAQGVAYAATRAGIPCTIVMPEGAPISKVAATKGYGARVVLAGGGYDEAYRAARDIQQESGATFIHGFNDVDVIAGQGTIALELLDELPEMGAVLVPVGGGGLIAGVAFALKKLKPEVRVIGVQAKGAPSMQLSYTSSHIVETDKSSTFADGIAIRRPGDITFDIVRSSVDEIVLVDDEEMAATILLLLERTKLVVEGAGAAGLAALLHQKVTMRGTNVVALISGGNIDMNVLSIIIRRGLSKTGRYVRIRTVLTDRPGNLRGLLAVIAKSGANVISVYHDRTKPDIPIKQAGVELALETHNRDHIDQVAASLVKSGYPVEIIS